MTKPTIAADKSLVSPLAKSLGHAFRIIDADLWRGRTSNASGSNRQGDAPDDFAAPMAVVYSAKAGLSAETADLASALHVPQFCLSEKEDISGQMFGLLAELTKHLCTRATDAHILAATLRREFDDIQRNFHNLERAIDEGLIPPLLLALALPLSALSARLRSDSDIIQKLPTSARGVAGIELHFPEQDNAFSDGHLTLSVEDLTGTVLADPQIVSAQALSRGWCKIVLPRAIDCNDCDMQLRISAQGLDGILVSLAPPSPLTEFNASDTSIAQSYDSPLAVKVWKGFAGLRTVVAADTSADATIVKRRAADLPPAKTLFFEGEDMGFDPVQFWAKEDAFLVHPPPTGVTVGVIEGIECKALLGVTALVCNGHREAPLLSFAVGVVPHGAMVHISEALGPWLSLAPLAWGEVHSALEAKHDGKIDVLIACMAAREKGNRMAWGLFRGLVLHIQRQ